MAMSNEEFFTKLRETTEVAAKHSKAVDKSWHNVADSVDKIAAKTQQGWGGALAKVLGIQESVTRISKVVSDTMFGEGTKLITERLEKIKDLHFTINALSAKRNANLRFDRQDKDALKDAESKLALAEQEIFLSEHMEAMMKSKAFHYLPAILTATVSTAQWYDKYRNALVEASSNLSTQYDLIKDASVIQRMTGATQDSMTESIKAATHYGLDLNGKMRQSLEIITKMKEGMGAAAESTAEMLAVMNRINTPVNRVADAVARIKADTALSVDSASKMASELGRAMSLLNGGGGPGASEIIEYIGKLEGASQGLGTQAGALKDMLVGFTQERGLTGIATLGFEPDFLKDLEKTKKVTEGFVNYVEQQLSGTTGYQRMIQMQVLAQQFGTTIDVIGNARRVMDAYNKQQKTKTTLEGEWTKQTSTFSMSWSRLKESMGSLLKTAILPLIEPLATVTGYFAEMVGWLTKFETPIKVISTLLVGWGGFKALQMIGLKSVSALQKPAGGVVASTILGLLKKYLPLMVGGLLKIPGGKTIIKGISKIPSGKAITRGISKIPGGKAIVKGISKISGGKAVARGISKIPGGRVVTNTTMGLLQRYLPMMSGGISKIPIGITGVSVILAGISGFMAGRFFSKITGLDSVVEKWFSTWFQYSKPKSTLITGGNFGSGWSVQQFEKKAQAVMDTVGRGKEFENWFKKNVGNVDIISGQKDMARRERLISALQERMGRMELVSIHREALTGVTSGTDESMANQREQIALAKEMIVNLRLTRETFKESFKATTEQAKWSRDALDSKEANLYLQQSLRGQSRDPLWTPSR